LKAVDVSSSPQVEQQTPVSLGNESVQLGYTLTTQQSTGDLYNYSTTSNSDYSYLPPDQQLPLVQPSPYPPPEQQLPLVQQSPYSPPEQLQNHLSPLVPQVQMTEIDRFIDSCQFGDCGEKYKKNCKDNNLYTLVHLELTLENVDLANQIVPQPFHLNIMIKEMKKSQVMNERDGKRKRHN